MSERKTPGQEQDDTRLDRAERPQPTGATPGGGERLARIARTPTALRSRGSDRPRTDLKELARFASMGGAPAARNAPAKVEEAESSGVIDLPALAASAAQGQRLAERPRPSAPRTNSADEPFGGASERAPKRRAAAWISLTGLIAASTAAGGVFYGRAHHDGDPRAALAVSASPNGAAPESAAPGAPIHRPTDTAPPSPSPSDPHAATPGDNGLAAVPPRPSTPSATVATSKRAADDRPPSGPPSSLASGGDSNLQALMRQAVGGAARPAAANGSPPPESSAPEGVPLKPSLGAVQGAVGTALPAARACLGPDDPIARATLTFGSDGSVESVAVSGDAAGTPAEACIRTALRAAKLPPFASPTFTWTATVRPP